MLHWWQELVQEKQCGAQGRGSGSMASYRCACRYTWRYLQCAWYKTIGIYTRLGCSQYICVRDVKFREEFSESERRRDTVISAILHGLLVCYTAVCQEREKFRSSRRQRVFVIMLPLATCAIKEDPLDSKNFRLELIYHHQELYSNSAKNHSVNRAITHTITINSVLF